MRFKIIHLVDNLSKINFGIWNAAVFASDYLQNEKQISSSVWVLEDNSPTENVSLIAIPVVHLGKKISKKQLLGLVQHYGLLTNETIIVSHGCWQGQTRLAYNIKLLGFKWIYTPHGMLEPWSLKHKRLKKWVYFQLVESSLAVNADLIRAVSRVEQNNLSEFFNKPIITIENGVRVEEPNYYKSSKEKIFLFMARLHPKKGILPLVIAWSQVIRNEDFCTLIIAGPDEGELEKIKPYLNESIKYLGSVYGKDKVSLLSKAHYFILPSFSEGFPTSVVEAMSFGLIPIISPGCNFQSVFENNLGFLVQANMESISEVLNMLKNASYSNELSRRNYEYIVNHNSEQYIGEILFNTYSELLSN